MQLVCQVFSSFRRVRRQFRPFAGPGTITRDITRHTDNAGSTTLSSSNSLHTVNTRPLQDQLRDQMEIHNLQREGLPESAQTQQPKKPTKRPSGNRKLDADRRNSKSADQLPARSNNSRRRRYRGNAQSAGRATGASEDSKVPDSARPVRQQVAQEAALNDSDRKRPRTLSKQEDIALCSAIKASGCLWLQLQSFSPSATVHTLVLDQPLIAITDTHVVQVGAYTSCPALFTKHRITYHLQICCSKTSSDRLLYGCRMQLSSSNNG